MRHRIARSATRVVVLFDSCTTPFRSSRSEAMRTFDSAIRALVVLSVLPQSLSRFSHLAGSRSWLRFSCRRAQERSSSGSATTVLPLPGRCTGKPKLSQRWTVRTPLPKKHAISFQLVKNSWLVEVVCAAYTELMCGLPLAESQSAIEWPPCGFVRPLFYLEVATLRGTLARKFHTLLSACARIRLAHASAIPVHFARQYLA